MVLRNRSQPAVMMCCAGSICIVQIQLRKLVVNHADYTAPARQHELHHTDHKHHTVHTDHTDHTNHTDHTYHTDHIEKSI